MVKLKIPMAIYLQPCYMDLTIEHPYLTDKAQMPVNEHYPRCCLKLGSSCIFYFLKN